MGSGASKEAGAEYTTRPVTGPVNLTWKTDQAWTAWCNSGREAGHRFTQDGWRPGPVFGYVRNWLQRQCSCGEHCIREESDRANLPLINGDDCQWPVRAFFIVDGALTTVVHAVAIVYAVPQPLGQGVWPTTGTWLNSPQMDRAKLAAIRHMTELEKRGWDMGPAELSIFMGADMVRAEWRRDDVEPRVKMLQECFIEERSWQLFNDTMVKELKYFAGNFAAVMQPRRVVAMMNEEPASDRNTSIWDEGRLPFHVSGQPYPHATRLFTIRDDKRRNRRIRSTEHKIIFEDELRPYEVKKHIMRNDEPGKIMGGIVKVILVCGLSNDAPWPRHGKLIDTEEMRAANVALIETMRALNRQGDLSRGVGEVIMGGDRVQFRFLGRKFPVQHIKVEDASPRIEGDLDGLFMKLEGIDDYARPPPAEEDDSALAPQRGLPTSDTDRYRAQMYHTAADAAARFLRLNFPGMDITTQSSWLDGDIPDASLTVARDLSQDQRIVAAVYAIPYPKDHPPPSPGGQEHRSWLGTQDLRDAVEALLGLMRWWHTEGKIAEGCGRRIMAQVAMGADADVYHFVDGQRFEDPTEKEMSELKWP